MSTKVQEKKISSLIHDDKNMNKHNQYGMHLLEKSISALGLGRSILVDKNNRIIGGNGVTETAASLGLEDCIVVETTGDQLVVVKRTDVDLDSKIGRELALADNSVAHVNLDWDDEAIQEVSESWGIKPEDWGVTEFSESPKSDEDAFDDKGISPKNQFGVIVLCEDEQEQTMFFAKLKEQGYSCKVVVV